MTVQEALGVASVNTAEMEGKLNTFATFISAAQPLREAGFDMVELREMLTGMGINFGHDFLGTSTLDAYSGTNKDRDNSVVGGAPPTFDPNNPTRSTTKYGPGGYSGGGYPGNPGYPYS